MSENKKMSASIKYCILMPIVLAVLYLIGIADLAYGYYTFLRIFSLIFLGIFIVSYCMTCADLNLSCLNFPNIAAGAVLILFNPLFPIYMDKDTWVIFDAISAVVMFVISIYVLCQYKSENK